MIRSVNGDNVELSTGVAEISPLADRVVVRSKSGVNTALAVRDGSRTLVPYRGRQFVVEAKRVVHGGGAGEIGSGELRAPMNGTIADVRAEVGDSVKRGTAIIILEAMKTQQPLVAPFDGVVGSIRVEAGNQAKEGEILAVIKPII